jgi:hypothetical protein
MKYFIMLTAIFLVACNGTVTSDHIQMAEKLCAPNGGLRSIWEAKTYQFGKEFSMETQCNNLVVIYYSWEKK